MLADLFGTCDPFVVLKHGGKEAKTSVKKGCYEAEWRERFELSVQPGDTGEGLLLRCMDWDMGSFNDFVGQADIRCALP